jgi:type IV pilus assembly protein PilY1
MIPISLLSNPAITGTRPNVLIILDNSANWSASLAAGTKFAAEVAALNTVLGGLGDKFNVGLMLFGETGVGNKNPVTSYMRYAVRTMNTTNSTNLKSLIANLDINRDRGSNAPYGFSLLEAFKYFGGGTASPQDATHFGPTAFGGFGQQKRDYAGNPNNAITNSLPGKRRAS